MHDPWTDMMSAYIDGELAPAEAASLEQHLASCDDCNAMLAELRDVVAGANALPAGEPPRDLWPAIATAIAGPAAQASRADAVLSAADDIAVIRLDEARSTRRARQDRHARFSFSLPQLAAAAVVLMAIGGAAVFLLAGGVAPGVGVVAADETTQGAIVLSSSPVSESVRLVGAPPAFQRFESDVATLEQALEDARSSLDPATVEVVERSLESIDLAIADAKAALDADPANPHLHRKLESTLEKKLALLSRASGVQRGGS
jgi:anti-sigma factor RsiW